MKVLYKQYIAPLTVLIEMALILTPIKPSVAQNIPRLSNNGYNNPQIINGLYNLEQRNFFREGRKQLDREIEELYVPSRSKPGNILQLNPEQIQRQLEPLELPQLLHQPNDIPR